MSDFLFELGIEEVPVSEIQPILTQLKSKFQLKLQENLVEYGPVETAATNKRMMIYFSRINAKANDKEEQIKGPAKRIAYDDKGEPTIPLQKFIEFNQVEMSDLSEMETKKGIYMVVEKKAPGLPTVDILKQIIPTILGELAFNKSMVWNASRVPFIRPVKNILVLFDNDILPLEFAGVHSSSFVTGHHLLSESPIEVHSFRDYCELLGKNFVMIREEERKEKITGEIKDIEEEFNARVALNDGMLEDYLYNNEYPVVFQGNFHKKYLELPSEIISTFMINEKKLLPVHDKQGNLMNMFVGVSNIPDENHHVTGGNERVITATFEDAKFFWDNDRKDDFVELRQQLVNVMFHKDLGNFHEKTGRLADLVAFLVQETGNQKLAEQVQTAALLCKNDLVTRMVREFPSLQGIMGGLYLKEKGIAEETWKSVYSHYEPKGFHSDPMEHVGAGLLSIADKMDNIAGFLSRGIRISSSKDPYGIRRDANAIIKVILDFGFDFDLKPLIQKASANFSTDEMPVDEIVKKVEALFLSRLEGVFKDFLGVRYDVVNSVLTSDDLSINRLHLRAVDVSKIVETDNIEHLTALHKRLKNIAKKSENFNVSEDRLKEKEEKVLYDIFKESRANIEAQLLNHHYLQACAEILEMKPVIDNFFDAVMVMAEERELRENRIAMVQRLDQLLSRIADFSLIVS
ncbi:MAG: glycine--tRNA ligase subunit beta [bacterium]|nr:glycine--tRNA ligase subunit beta [bacterium]